MRKLVFILLLFVGLVGCSFGEWDSYFMGKMDGNELLGTRGKD